MVVKIMSFQIRSYQVTLVANTPVQFTGGKYFTIEEASADVDITFKGQQGNIAGVAQNVGAGFWCDVEQFGLVEIESSSAQTISVIVGSAGSGEPVRFGVNKTSTSITGGTLTPRTLSSDQVSAICGIAISTLILPATNTNGIRIDGITWARGAANGFCTCQADTALPTSFTADVNALYLSTYDGDDHSVTNIPAPYIVPSGMGIYCAGNQAVAGTCYVHYEIL